MSWCLKLHASVSHFSVLNVHIPAYQGGSSFFKTLKFFGVSVDRRLERIRISLSESFQYIEVTTTTHNDIVCISFNSKSAHSNPSIFTYIQKEDSLSIPTVLGSGGHGLESS